MTLTNVTNNSPSRDYSHQDDQTTQTTETPGFKPFTVIHKQVHTLHCEEDNNEVDNDVDDDNGDGDDDGGDNNGDDPDVIVVDILK